MAEFYVAPTLFSGRPEDNDTRLEKERSVYDLLEALEIPFERADHEPANTIEDCIAVEKVIGVEICKNLFLCNRQKTTFYLLMMPAKKPFRTADVSKKIGSSRLSFAGEEFMQEFLDITPGSVSIMGLKNDKDNRVQLLMDGDIARSEYIRCHPCINTSTLKIKTSDILEKFLPHINHEPVIVEIDG